MRWLSIAAPSPDSFKLDIAARIYGLQQWQTIASIALLMSASVGFGF